LCRWPLWFRNENLKCTRNVFVCLKPLASAVPERFSLVSKTIEIAGEYQKRK
jgi:hypothetical protein